MCVIHNIEDEFCRREIPESWIAHNAIGVVEWHLDWNFAKNIGEGNKCVQDYLTTDKYDKKNVTYIQWKKNNCSIKVLKKQAYINLIHLL